LARAKSVHSSMDTDEQAKLTETIIAGLPGRMTDAYSLADFRAALARYAHMDHAALRANLVAFLARVLPAAEKLDVKLAIHPDDPPWDMFGLPRVNCTPDDLDQLFEAAPSPCNGITLCVGTYGSRADNDLPQMARQFRDRIFFAHLRGVTRDPAEQRSFFEASHLDSDIDMVAVIRNLAENESASGREIFIRPDHGHLMLGDISKSTNPGYSAIGRMKGLAEIRGVIRAVNAQG
ncbi:MAG: mannonate dehydratase, partial [Marinomonas sp.]